MKVNLAIRFMLEMCGLVAVSYWGFQTGSGFLMKAVLGIGSPFLLATIWGIFVAPKSALRVKGSGRVVLELIIFGVAALAIYDVGKLTLAIILAIVAVVSSILNHLWEQQR
ncbi:YrdB family protein [Sporosarcina sp. ACRSL]|uniref:YrdB family protein n=1 Tax=Sporosarcina sp. ACRSL TaxID=2918215 RepID=UPI001EF70446|nr:YrdB family protein [Sporosarcina sp. ACRSL]MCG7344766.1 YrdB family protein [Sporosarcina sp. ACRSL]